MSNCNYYQMLTSAEVDGEITSDERKALQLHLKNCDDCRTLQNNFKTLDRLVVGAVAVEDSGCGFEPELPCVESLGPPVSPGWNLRFGVIGGLAASFVLAMAIFNTGSEKNTNPVATGAVIPPLVKLVQINSHRLQDQELLRESLEFDLRTLKLQMESKGTENRDVMLDRIDALMRKVEKAKSSKSDLFLEL